MDTFILGKVGLPPPLLCSSIFFPILLLTDVNAEGRRALHALWNPTQSNNASFPGSNTFPGIPMATLPISRVKILLESFISQNNGPLCCLVTTSAETPRASTCQVHSPQADAEICINQVVESGLASAPLLPLWHP